MENLLVKKDKPIRKEIDKAIKRVLDKGQFILGPELKAFEEEVAKFCKVKYAVGVNSGTDALWLSLKALDIHWVDEVITTPFSFISSAEVIAQVEAKPVFVDINYQDFLINTSLIGRAINRRTRAIILVHLFGQVCDMPTIMRLAKEYKLYVIEDAAQAFGTEGIGQGDITCFSFYPTKILGAYGDAGMVITNNKRIADRIRLLRNHGSSPKDKYKYLEFGANSRLDEIQAAILRVKLRHFKKTDWWKDTKKLYYPLPLHLQPCFKYLGYKKGDFPIAEKIAKQVYEYRKSQT